MAESVDQKRLWRAEDGISELHDGQARIETRLSSLETRVAESFQLVGGKLDSIQASQKVSDLELHDIKHDVEKAKAWKKWGLTIVSGASAIAIKELAALILRHT